ncbi:MAG: domain S-box protein [Bacteroidetes bacterium]|nr:domain S-box protein [Bacteroidota bacterium]
MAHNKIQPVKGSVALKKEAGAERLIKELKNVRAEMQAMAKLQEQAKEEFLVLNEQLEISQKETEASNEKLLLINNELQIRNELLTESYNYSAAIIATIHEPMIILDEYLRIKSANKAFYKKFLTSKEATVGLPLFELGNKQWSIPKLKKQLEGVLYGNNDFYGFEVKHTFPGIGEKIMQLNAHRIIQKNHKNQLILLAMEDITERTLYHFKEKEQLNTDILLHKADKEELENAVKARTGQIEQKNLELERANKEWAFQNIEKEKRAAELRVANAELAFQNNEKEKRAAELSVANIELAFQNDEKEKRAAELGIANKELAFQNNEKEKRAAELSIANIELAFQNNEKEKRATELSIANTELAFQNDEKEKRAAELSIANKDLTTFTYVSSHDLQEPLRKIQNFVVCILREEEKNLSATGKGYFLRMRETARRMQNLIEDLLTYSRTKSTEHKFEHTNLDKIMNEVLSDFEEILKEKKAAIEYSALGHADIIPFQFRQLLHNLVTNSLKFSRPDIPAHIIVKSKIINGKDAGHPKLSAEKNYLDITFSDNGIGFDPQYKELIFEVFQRLYSFDEYKGTGIGLAICKRIAENHQGIITAIGKLDEGAAFNIFIPVE